MNFKLYNALKNEVDNVVLQKLKHFQFVADFRATAYGDTKIEIKEIRVYLIDSLDKNQRIQLLKLNETLQVAMLNDLGVKPTIYKNLETTVDWNDVTHDYEIKIQPLKD